MTIRDLIQIYKNDERVLSMVSLLSQEEKHRLVIKGMVGSFKSLLAAACIQSYSGDHLFILSNQEDAAYFYNDLEKLFEESGLDFSRKNILFFPASYKKPYEPESVDNANVLMRSEVLHRMEHKSTQTILVSYPDAFTEKVVSRKFISAASLKLEAKQTISHDSLLEWLENNQFESVDFIAEAGEYAVRGGIIDIFSFSGDYPVRLEFFGDELSSIRTFDPVTQLSLERLNQVSILPNVQKQALIEQKIPVFSHFEKDTVIWIDDVDQAEERIQQSFLKAESLYKATETPIIHLKPHELYLSGKDFLHELGKFSTLESGQHIHYKQHSLFSFHTQPQPAFNKKFELLIENLQEHLEQGYKNYILSENPKQIQRLERVFFELGKNTDQTHLFSPLNISLYEGFTDDDHKLCCYTDHQIFERYHRFSTHHQRKNLETITLKELYELKPGDFVTHIDHGVGRFSGLEKIEVNGHHQETIRLVYKDNDVLYVSIHALHKISRYTGKEGMEPTLNRLGSNTWNNLKNKTKQRVKDIAKDLIKLYAQRKASKGFAFSGDSYLQNELEASFLYEDTPDQSSATTDVKADMESPVPMDRLICGDVGFGKTEIAIRAAFKAVADGKQVAVLVPTTVLAFQHYKTFKERLSDMPCQVDYISRFRSAKEKTAIVKDLKEGRIDILIGTHKIIGKELIFKDLGLLIIDEEQKFGVGMKEKLKQLKVNVDTLTLTATPIPRTLQFSLMGARDMSIIKTPPPNRYPVHTEIQVFNEEILRDAIVYELSRGGQVFFVHSRVQNINEIAGMIQRLVPDARIGIGHGQMEGAKLEEVMLAFIEGETDILVATKIVENGLDIPNANTIIINEAHVYGLSELHQLRGRVGRSNKKSFCYLITPPPYMLTDEAKKRLRAIEEFSDIGSGFNIAMRDLDIRGAGNILGAEQSGFISEIGLDMYQKILDEAIQELKHHEFKELYADETAAEEATVKECVMETDLEILIPDYYVNNIAERLSLYKKLDGLETDKALYTFMSELTDRFGEVPAETIDLINAVKLRRIAKYSGFEKIVLKQGKLKATFAGQEDASYFQSEQFGKILNYVQTNSKTCKMSEQQEKLILVFDQISTIDDAISLLTALSL